VTTASALATGTTDTIGTAEWAAVALLAQDGINGTNGTNGTNGQRGSIEAAASITGTSWSDAAAVAAISAAGYGAPVLLDRVTLYNSSANYTQSKYYDGAAWQTWAALVDGNLLVNGSVAANKLSVNQLDAISATVGLLRSATSGARLEISTDVIRVYDSSGALRVKLGNLA
jgi:hypothetical protein